jgi:hypothetical protein
MDKSGWGKMKRQLLVGASVFSWMVWLSKNNVVFDKTPAKFFMQVLYMATY